MLRRASAGGRTALAALPVIASLAIASRSARPDSCAQPSHDDTAPSERASRWERSSPRAAVPNAPSERPFWAGDPAFGKDPRSWVTTSNDAPDRRAPAGVRGVTVGPIESALHPRRGYGTQACARTMDHLVRMGANWVSITPYGRIADLRPTGIDLTFEAPFEENRRAIERAVQQAHERGLRVLLVPHLWVESGGWRGEIDPGSPDRWAKWTEAYRRFLLTWAEVAARSNVDMMSVGVELGSWATTPRAASLRSIIGDVRRTFSGPLTYSANWDDIDATLILGAIDVIGINAFYPLAEADGAGWPELYKGAQQVAERVHRLASIWHKPILFTELGYTTRPNPAIHPWEWPDRMRSVVVDEAAQALAYRALLAPVLEEPGFFGFFVWRVYADPEDVSQEAEWGFSPLGKRAELVMRDAFRASWAADGLNVPGLTLAREAATVAGLY